MQNETMQTDINCKKTQELYSFLSLGVLDCGLPIIKGCVRVDHILKHFGKKWTFNSLQFKLQQFSNYFELLVHENILYVKSTQPAFDITSDYSIKPISYEQILNEPNLHHAQYLTNKNANEKIMEHGGISKFGKQFHTLYFNTPNFVATQKNPKCNLVLNVNVLELIKNVECFVNYNGTVLLTTGKNGVISNTLIVDCFEPKHEMDNDEFEPMNNV